jgi:DNA-binding transcriptional MerR regulator
MRTTGMPIRSLREYAGLRRQDTPASAARRKQILLEHRTDVRERLSQLAACLEVLDHKIDNYEQVERSLAAVTGRDVVTTPEEESA